MKSEVIDWRTIEEEVPPVSDSYGVFPLLIEMTLKNHRPNPMVDKAYWTTEGWFLEACYTKDGKPLNMEVWDILHWSDWPNGPYDL